VAINFPANPSNGDTHAGFTYSSSVGAWKATAGVSTTLSNTAPTSPSNGDLWWNTNTSKLYISYDDGSSTQWVQAAVPGATGAAGAAGSSVTSYANSSIFPSSGNSVGDFAFATNTKAVYIWDGSEWDRISTGVDESPVIITEPPTTTQVLNNDGTTSTVTMLATDPEGFDITYGIAYKNAGSTLPIQLASATTVNSNGVYTLTPSANNSHAGSFRARLSASDGARTTTRLVDFSLTFSVTGEILLVAGGGGGNDSAGGGGGGGGYVEDSAYEFQSATAYNITVGTGGAVAPAQDQLGYRGGDSKIASGGSDIYVATGGGGGGGVGNFAGTDLTTALNGGSGGGAGRASDGPGLGLQASYSGKGFGNDGGNDTSNQGAGGGGGAGSAGTNGAGSGGTGGDGGDAKQSSITGTATYYAGGGPGGGYDVSMGSYGTGGGASVIGNGGKGGIWNNGSLVSAPGNDGVVIIATQEAAASVTGTYTLDTSGRSGYYVYTFTANGSITF